MEVVGDTEGPIRQAGEEPGKEQRVGSFWKASETSDSMIREKWPSVLAANKKFYHLLLFTLK